MNTEKMMNRWNDEAMKLYNDEGMSESRMRRIKGLRGRKGCWVEDVAK